MSIQKRLAALERQAGDNEPKGIPVKPSEWTDEQYDAIIIGLGIRNRPFTLLGIGRHFKEKYQEPIKQILDGLEQGIKPKGVIVQAEPLEFKDIIEMDRLKYGL